MDHSFNNFTINFSWTFIWLNIDIIMMNITSWHWYLKMVSTKHNWSAFSPQIWSTWTIKYYKLKTEFLITVYKRPTLTLPRPSGNKKIVGILYYTVKIDGAIINCHLDLVWSFSFIIGIANQEVSHIIFLSTLVLLLGVRKLLTCNFFAIRDSGSNIRSNNLLFLDIILWLPMLWNDHRT